MKASFYHLYILSEKENFSDYDGDDVDEEERWKKDDERNKNDPKMCWKIGGATKDRALTRLIKNFSNLVVEIGDDDNEFENDDDDTNSGPTFDNGGRPANRQCAKGIKALDLVKKTTLFLRNYDNEDTKDFTIFLAKNQIIQSKLLQLLELCADDDDIPLAMECCKLLLVLGRMHHPKNDARLVVKLPGKSAKETKEEGEKRFAKESSKRENLLKQKSAMLCIKEAFSTTKSAKIIMTAFRAFMEKELARPSEDAESQKVVDGPYNNLFRCLRYLRIMLEVDAVPSVSSESECAIARRAQCKLVIYYKSMLGALPAILSDINRKPYRGNRYHDTWLVDVILIVYNILRGHSPQDLYRVYAAGGLQGDDEVAGKEVRVPLAIANRAVDQVCQKGVLANKLLLEKQKTASRDLGSRRGNFVKKLDTRTVQFAKQSPDNDDDNTASAQQRPMAPTQLHLRNPFGTGDARVHQAKAKRARKKTTFDVKEQLDKTSCDSYSDSMERDGPAASVVVANIIDRICNTGLRELVLRVNDDLRREENIVSPDEQLAYFKILSTCMQYNRLKKDSEKRKSASTDTPWAPDVRNVIHALDSMSWNRVLVAMETLHTAKQFKDIHVPMELYKEMICYLKLMLDSADINHHELAIARLYRLFYSLSRERQDPLATLLRQWRPATYGPKHINCLVELVHETMKTLERARERFNKYSSDDKKKLRKKGKDVDIETYISSCLRFNIDDYFQRLVNYQTISIYTRLLAKMELNPPHINHVNHYVYSFLKRMNSFRLEQELKAPMPSSAALMDGSAALPSQSGDISLAYVLFNVSSLNVISSVLNNPILANQKENYEMMTLLKVIVRRFFEAAKKNHMLFVEALFHHPHCHDFVLQLDNVYDAPAFLSSEKASSSKGRGARSDSDSSSGSSSSEEEPVRAKEDFGDAFDEDDLADAFKLTKKKRDKKSSGDRKEQRSVPRKKDRATLEDEGPSRSSSRVWSPEEDAVVREVYAQYAGTSAVFNMIAGSQALVDLGRNRTSKQVAKRARELKLHLTLNSNESDDDASTRRRLAKDSAKKASAKPRKPAVSDWSKDEDSTLEKLYRMHRGSSNVFELVARDKGLKSFGMTRSADDVEERVQALRLYLQGEDSEDEAAENTSTPSAPDRSWDEEEDDFLKGLYATYGDLPNAFEIIASDHSFNLVHVDGRSRGEVERRVHHLRLDPNRDYDEEEKQRHRGATTVDGLDLNVIEGGESFAARLRDWEDDSAATDGRKHSLSGEEEKAGQGRVRKMARPSPTDDEDDALFGDAHAAEAENLPNNALKGRKRLVDSDDEG